MTRPLMYKTAREMEIIVERNRDSAPELDLVLSELKHRKTLSGSPRNRKKVHELF